MTLLEVIHRAHQRQPDLAGWSLGRAALVHQARNVFRLEVRKPPIHRRTRDVQDATDTELMPALIIELDHLDPGLIAVSLAVIVTQREFPWHRWEVLLPELLHRIGMEAVAVLVEDNPD